MTGLGRLRRALVAVALVTVVVTSVASAASTGGRAAAEPPPITIPPIPLPPVSLPHELKPALAILSPVASPACSSVGLPTLLLPAGFALLAQAIPQLPVDLSTVVAPVLGPVYLFCGQIPVPPSTTCQVDQRIKAALPPQTSQLGIPGPQAIAINLVLALQQLPAGVGVPLPLTAAEQLAGLLTCTIGGGVPAPAPTPLPPPIPAPVTTPVAAPPAPLLPLPSGPLTPARAPVTRSPAVPRPAASEPGSILPAAPTGFVTVTSEVVRWLRAPGLVALVLLGALLARAWFVSWLIERRSRVAG